MNVDAEKVLSSERVQTSFLSRIERRALDWIIPKLPEWMGPDLLTFIGLFAMAAVGVFYCLASVNEFFLIGASVGLVLNWFGDSLDGGVARYRKKQRPKYGYYLDHLVDTFGTSFLLFGLAYSGLVTRPLCFIFLVIYLIMCINTYLATQATGVFKISFAGFSPTEGRVLLIILNTVLLFWQQVPIFSRRIYILDVLLGISGIVLLVLMIRSAALCLRKLDKEEREAWQLNGKR